MFSLLTDRSCGREYGHRYSFAKTNNKFTVHQEKRGEKDGLIAFIRLKQQKKTRKQTENRPKINKKETNKQRNKTNNQQNKNKRKQQNDENKQNKQNKRTLAKINR